MRFNNYKRLSLVALMLILSGCFGSGGGGGGGGGNTSAALSGSAVKGIIKNGVVVAQELGSTGNVIGQVGSAMTGADGSYSLTLNSSYKGGPIQITISADANTEMKCDIPAGCGTVNGTAVNFGDWYKPGAGNLSMSALVAEASTGDTLSVNVTPFTDMAARRAKESATLDKNAVYDANSEVSVLLGGINILSTKPLDITDSTAVGNGSPTEIAYAAYASAIGSLANTSSGSPDINAALDTLGASFAGGVIAADDGGSNPNFSLQEIIDGAQSALTQAGVVDTSGTLVAMEDEVTSAGTGGTVNPQPSPTAGVITLDKVKAFVADVRTWGNVISSEMQAKADAFSSEADLASTAASSTGDLLMSPAMNNTLDAIGGYIDGTYTGTDLSAYGLGFTSGTISNTGSTYTIANAVYDNGNGQTVAVSLTGEVPQDGSTATSFTFGITSASFESDAADAYINSGTITITTSKGYTIDWTAINNGTAAQPDLSGGSVDLDISLTQKQDQTGTPLAASVTYKGKVAVTLTNPIKNSKGDGYVWITPKTLTLSGGVMDSNGNSLDFNLTANVANADTFVPVNNPSVGDIKSNIISWAYTNNNNTFTLATPFETVTVAWDSVSLNAVITQSYSDGNVATNTSGPYNSLQEALSGVTASGALTDVYNNITYSGGYIWIDGEGGYTVDTNAFLNADFSTNGGLDGTLVDPDFVLEDASHWLDATVGLSFNLQLSGLPKASITISADRTDYQSGNATLTLSYGTRKIAINGSFTDTSTTGSIDVTNQDGVTMTISGANLDTGDGTISYNGTTYATITSMSNGLTKISYSDGTFETF